MPIASSRLRLFEGIRALQAEEKILLGSCQQGLGDLHAGLSEHDSAHGSWKALEVRYLIAMPVVTGIHMSHVITSTRLKVTIVFRGAQTVLGVVQLAKSLTEDGRGN